MSKSTQPIDLIHNIDGLRVRVSAWRAEGFKIALVPTMGALHEGHLSLVDLARQKADKIIVSIFINKTQFGPKEDFESYPRNLEEDKAKLISRGVDVIFAPGEKDVYPPGFATQVEVKGLTDCLCGLKRPGHFTGVATIVTKLLNQAQADIAIFGNKDFQQLLAIKRLARDLDIATEILGAPIVREADGLALSSRNQYLSQPERIIAGQFNQVLKSALADIKADMEVTQALDKARTALEAAGITKIDYLELRDSDTLAPTTEAIKTPDRPRLRLFGAVFVGETRLIDNMAL